MKDRDFTKGMHIFEFFGGVSLIVIRFSLHMYKIDSVDISKKVIEDEQHNEEKFGITKLSFYSRNLNWIKREFLYIWRFTRVKQQQPSA